jgi:hypothetical protein
LKHALQSRYGHDVCTPQVLVSRQAPKQIAYSLSSPCSRSHIPGAEIAALQGVADKMDAAATETAATTAAVHGRRPAVAHIVEGRGHVAVEPDDTGSTNAANAEVDIAGVRRRPSFALGAQRYVCRARDLGLARCKPRPMCDDVKMFYWGEHGEI